MTPNANILRQIALGTYKHAKTPEIQVSYKSGTIYMKWGGSWHSKSIKQAVTEVYPDSPYMLRLVGVKG